jgi:hypothetical protein
VKYKIKETGVIIEQVSNYSFKIGNEVWELECLDKLGLHLEPYEEPLKKLYAKKSRYTGMISFWDDDGAVVGCDRVPQYDIEYEYFKKYEGE